jgi:hypothetical protein
MEKAGLAISKLIILTIVKKLPAITQSQLTNLSLETLYMDYFTFVQAFQDLIRDKLLVASNRKDENRTDAGGKPVTRCDITSQGDAVLTTLSGQIPMHVKTYLHQIMSSRQKDMRREHDVRSNYSPDANGHFIVSLSQHDGIQEIMSISLSVPDKEMAKKICRQWKNQPGTTYVAVLALLAGEVLPNSSESVTQSSRLEEEPAGSGPAQPYQQEQSLF